MPKKRILILTAWYLPGYRAGGPVRSIANLVRRLGEEADFYILTTDRDLGGNRPYPGTEAGKWSEAGHCRIMYLDAGRLSASVIREMLLSGQWDCVYLNSLFSYYFTIVPLRTLKRSRPGTPVVLAPRGMLGKGALAIKPVKKRLFLALAKLAGLYRNVQWQASSDHERAEIANAFGKAAKVTVAANVFAAGQTGGVNESPSKKPGEIRLAFLSRIAEKKNLHVALKILKHAAGPGTVAFDIYGPVEDARYWKSCEALIAELPANIRAVHRGAVEAGQVQAVLSAYHFLLLPTRHENFGHVIIESLAAGCPVLISDRTPWRNLEEQHLGWDIAPDDKEKWRSVLGKCIAMDDAAWQALRENCRTFARRYEQEQDAVQKHRELLGLEEK